MSHSISRISETLAGIYDENSLSQDFPSSDKGQEDSEPEIEPRRDYETEATCFAETPESKGLPGVDFTLPEELCSDQAESKASEPCRQVFMVDFGPKGCLNAEVKIPLEGKVSLEVVTIGNTKLRGGEKMSKGGRYPWVGRHSSVEWDGSGGGESEIEEGEIVQPEDERYSPIQLFRSRCQPAQQRTLWVVEGDDFLSLHADSDEKGSLQIDFSESQLDPHWKGVDLRRKILTQRQERYHHAISPLPPPPPPPAPKCPASKAHSGSSSASFQDLNDNDLFTIKRTITVNQQKKMEGLLETPERAKREVVYDSEGMSFDACFSDREPAENSKSSTVWLNPKEDAVSSRKDKRPEEDTKQKLSKEKELKRAYLEDCPRAQEKCKKKLKEGPPSSEQQELPKIEEKAQPDRDKTGKKIKAGSQKENSTLDPGRKVKLQSKVAILIQEGVSSTTSVKEMGSICVKFSRDKESRSPFLKSEEKVLVVGAPAAGQDEMTDVKKPGFKPKKVKGLKARMGVKKLKGIKPKGASEPKKKKKLKVKTGLKKSKADSCSQGAVSPLKVKEEPSWSGSEKSGTAKPPSPQTFGPGQKPTRFPDSGQQLQDT
ncbi:splicing factor arginine/serine-rich 19-like [Crotalus adamanteus]|uniref:Splicing factor arginine/serine-rich 19-like n=1 Tax=Crotalus adamanteus TaxID=8729 RepID=A0AAW1B0X2_CROAD